MQAPTIGAHVRLIVFLLVLSQFAFSGALSAQAERRIALVATNELYREPITTLAFSHRDGEIIAAALTSLNFKVTHVKDASRKAFRQSLQQFVARVKEAGPDAVAFFYFSGHAGDDGTRNYFIVNEAVPRGSLPSNELPADQQVASYRKAVASAAGIPFSEVAAALSAVDARARFFVVDSHLDLEEPSLYVSGQLLATQGRPGLNAADSNNYSLALSGALLTPGLEADAIFRQVQVKVAEVTNGRQIPFFVNKLNQPILLDRVGAVSRQRAADDAWLEEPLWGSVNGSNNKRLLQVYLERFPKGEHAEEARSQIAEFDRLASLTDKAPPQKPSPDGSTNTVERRVALVIGNSAYSQNNHLRNPVNDARGIAKQLKVLGFQTVQEHFDLGRDAMLQALKTFGEVARGADWTLIYYAGHGMEVKGVNYLIPIDAKLVDEEDVEEEAVAMTRLFDRLKDSSGVKILILDACRNNPFSMRMVRRGGTRGDGGKGLAEVKATSGTLIAYATNPGDVAFDGTGDYSPYVTALLRHMPEPGLDIRIMFSRVYETVEQDTKKRQQPWYAAQLPGRDLVLGRTGVAQASVPLNSQSPSDQAQSSTDEQRARSQIIMPDGTFKLPDMPSDLLQLNCCRGQMCNPGQPLCR